MAAAPSPPAPPAAASSSFEELYRATFERVYAYVASLLGDRSVAEDVTALAYERAYRKRASFRPGRGSPEAWLFGIARNAALDELRRRGRTARLHEDRAQVEGAGPASVEDLAERLAVRAAVASLDPRERDLVALRFAAGLTHGEIAQVLGVSESNAGTRLHRALVKLREACRDS